MVWRILLHWPYPSVRDNPAHANQGNNYGNLLDKISKSFDESKKIDVPELKDATNAIKDFASILTTKKESSKKMSVENIDFIASLLETNNSLLKGIISAIQSKDNKPASVQ